MPTVGMLIGVAILGNLCAWQVRRHIFKNRYVPVATAARELPPIDGSALTGDLEPLYFRHIRLQGRFEGAPMLEGGRALGHGPAYAVFQAFRLDSGERVLVDRGEIAPEQLSERLARVVQAGPVALEGQLRPLPESKDREPVGTDPLIWPKKSFAGIHRHAGDVLPSVYIRAGRPLSEGESPVPDPELASGYAAVVKKHDSAHYAKQWFAMALILLGMWGWVSYERESER